MATFSKALEWLKNGERITRVTWMGRNQYIFLVPGSKFKVNRPPLNEFYKEGTEIEYRPHIDICRNNNVVSVWNPDISDLLAEDWSRAEL